MKRVLSLVVVLAAVGVAAVGTVVWTRERAQDRETPAVSVTLDGLTATSGRATWTPMASHHMDTGGGYQMPAQMMPGAPEDGDVRLGVPVTLRNDGGEPRAFDTATDFVLVGPDRTSTPHSDTFGTLGRLGPGTAVEGVLYFDTTAPAPGDPPLQLVWRRDDEERRLMIRFDTEPEQGHDQEPEHRTSPSPPAGGGEHGKGHGHPS